MNDEVSLIDKDVPHTAQAKAVVAKNFYKFLLQIEIKLDEHFPKQFLQGSVFMFFSRPGEHIGLGCRAGGPILSL